MPYKDTEAAKARRKTPEYKARKAEIMRAWRKANPEKLKEQKRKSEAKRRAEGKLSAYAKEYNARNKARIDELRKKWAQANPDKRAGNVRARQARKLNATPAWADRSAMKEMYVQARKLTRETGTEHHVDHVVPLRSSIVCGLHCESNLRVITAAENRKKGNNRWPDMP